MHPIIHHTHTITTQSKVTLSTKFLFCLPEPLSNFYQIWTKLVLWWRSLVGKYLNDTCNLLAQKKNNWSFLAPIQPSSKHQLCIQISHSGLNQGGNRTIRYIYCNSLQFVLIFFSWNITCKKDIYSLMSYGSSTIGPDHWQQYLWIQTLDYAYHTIDRWHETLSISQRCKVWQSLHGFCTPTPCVSTATGMHAWSKHLA